MKSIVIYYSQYGNTRRIAETIAAILEPAGQARAIGIRDVPAVDLRDADLVVMGSPTHYQAVPKAVRSFLEGLPRHSLKGKWVAAFDTSVKMWGPIMLLTAAHGLMRKLQQLGGKTLARPQTFLVAGSDAPVEGEIDLLCEGEMERAGEWARMILNAAQSRGK